MHRNTDVSYQQNNNQQTDCGDDRPVSVVAFPLDNPIVKPQIHAPPRRKPTQPHLSKVPAESHHKPQDEQQPHTPHHPTAPQMLLAEIRFTHHDPSALNFPGSDEIPL